MIETMNMLSGSGTPFVFILDFLRVKPIVIPVRDIDPATLLFDFDGISNVDRRFRTDRFPFGFSPKPIPFERYKTGFDIVRRHELLGNSFLVNLTFPTPIEMTCGLRDVFFGSRARYKLWYRDEFVVFSPETFITIKDGIISSYPMKGTIDASVPDAEAVILNNEKEEAEHLTIVDLIRNDLNMVARNVTVEKYRYLETIRTNRKTLLHVSSTITGRLPSDYRDHLGEILYRLLPAGSVTGAPKKKTVEIIREAEQYDRGYYTGVCGYCDSTGLVSGVMIRFIEKQGDGFVFKSGGGITLDSDVNSEYRELLDKIYVPID